jgi:hypothetical protein
MFGPPTPYRTGHYPYGLAIGDLNEDGHPDLIVANDGDTTVTVLLGLGDGRFAPGVSVPLRSAVGGVTVGDVDLDGHLDVLAMLTGVDEVSILFGRGDGSFRPPVTYRTGWSPDGATLGDFNRDGWPDIVVSDGGHATSGSSLSVFMGSGGGTLSSQTSFYGGRWPDGIAARDLNGDGRLDLAVAGNGGISVLLGNGDGTFQTAIVYPAGTNPHSLAVGDLNGDGRLDLVTALYPDNVAVLLGNGDGTFGSAAQFLATSPQGIALADLDGDGRLDLVTAGWDANSISVLPGNGDGTFQPKTDIPVGSRCVSVAAADLNGDGRPDLVVTCALSDAVYVLLNDLQQLSTPMASDPDHLQLDGLRPNPAYHEVSVAFSLVSREPAVLDLLDITGRRAMTRDVGSLGPGRHVVRLADGASLPAGVYWLRLRQGSETRAARAVILR